MEPGKIQRLFINPDNSLREAMACIDRNAKGIALVVVDDGCLLATITDGDIRRAVLAGTGLNTPVSNLLSARAESAYSQPITAQVDTPVGELAALMRRHVVSQIPLLDKNGRVVDLFTTNTLLKQEYAPIEAVVMAGGFGTRLRPLTLDLPKPMLPIGDRPLLQRIVEQLQSSGIQNVNISTHYKPEKIKEHFGDGQKFGVHINYVSEDTPLGTAGALGLLAENDAPLLVINGDILTRVDFRAMRDYHRQYRADLTVAVRQYEVEVPYGVVECDGTRITRLREKPTYNFFVNAGIYLLQPDMRRYIPNGRRFDMTDLIETLLQAGKNVINFPIIEYWLDVGHHADYEQAQKDVENGRFAL
ncbi:MAG: NTP transferase domain-containing protein [Chloroflexi bacterium]|nr:NTP transferase domain-containing protein [Chloroflexota bacterium]